MPRQRVLIIAVLAFSQLIAMLDMSIVNTAIPAIAREFQASSATLQWLVGSFALVFAGFLLLAGALGDRYGRRRMLAIGLLIFAATSVGASFATSSATLIAFRAGQGVGAAIVVPQTLSILTAVFPREERGRALGIWAGALGLGTAGGPLLGGVLVDQIGWAAVFWVPAPVAGLALLGLRVVPESRSEGESGLDLPGALFGTLAVTGLVYGVIEGDRAGWGSLEIAGVLGLAAAALLLFLAVERRAATPMVPLHFFRQRDFNGGVCILFLMFFALLGVMFFLSQFFQLVQGKSAFTAGLYMLPLAIGIMVTGPLAGRLISVVGPRALILLAMVLSAGVLLSFTRLEIDSAYWPIGIALFLFGMGGGLVMPTVTDTIMASVPIRQAGRASGVSTTGRQVGGAMGIAVLGAVAATTYAGGVSNALTGVLPADLVAQVGDGIGAAVVLARGAEPEVAAAIEGAAFPAFVYAIRGVFWIGAAFMGLAGLAALFLIPVRMRATQMGAEPRAVPIPDVTASALRRATEMGLLRAHPQKAAPAPVAGD